MSKVVANVVAFSPLILFVALTALTGFFPTILDGVSTNILLGLLGLSILAAAFQFQERLKQIEDLYRETTSAVSQLAATQTSFILSTKRPVVPSTLSTAFATKASRGRHVKEMRVFAVSSQQILSFFAAENLVIDTVYLLIRGFAPEDDQHANFSNQIHLVAKDWQRLARSGRVNRLIIRSYDFFPTEYQVIFDKTAVIAGLYDSAPSDYSEVTVRDPVYIDGETSDGAAMIKTYIERFDNLFEQCLVHHGPQCYDAYCV